MKHYLILAALWAAIVVCTVIPAGMAWFDDKPYEALGIVALMGLMLICKWRGTP